MTTPRIVTCPSCLSSHIRMGDSDYCPNECGPTEPPAMKPHEVMNALRLPSGGFFMDHVTGIDDDYDPISDEMSHEDYIGWDIGDQ